MEMPNEDKFVRAPFNWLDIILLAVMASIMIYSITSNVQMGD